MALFDTLIGDLASRYGLGASAGPLVREVVNYVTGAPGGLGGFLEKMKASGFGSEMESWLGRTDASPMSAHLMDRVLGSGALGGMASRLGIGSSLLSTAVGYALPKIIGLMTPGGSVPAYMSPEVRNFLSAPTTTRVAPSYVDQRVAPRHIEVVHDEPHMTRWLWPLLGALAVLGLGSYLFTNNNRAPVAPPVVQAPPVQPAPAPTLPPRLALSNDNGVIHFSGSVHDEETRTTIINALRAAFGADRIQGDIGIDLNRGAAPWMVNLRNTLENFKVPGVQALFDGNSVNLGGAINETERDRIMNSLRNVLGAGMVFGALTDRTLDFAANANNKVVSALAGLKSGFEPRDLVGILNQSVVNFPPGTSEVPQAASPVLQGAASQMKELRPGTVLEIAGYTDNTGDPGANITLSQQRADAIRNALIHAGVDPSMLVAKGYGSANPVGDNDHTDGRFQNRRIEYHVIKS